MRKSVRQVQEHRSTRTIFTKDKDEQLMHKLMVTVDEETKGGYEAECNKGFEDLRMTKSVLAVVPEHSNAYEEEQSLGRTRRKGSGELRQNRGHRTGTIRDK